MALSSVPGNSLANSKSGSEKPTANSRSLWISCRMGVKSSIRSQHKESRKRVGGDAIDSRRIPVDLKPHEAD